MKRRVLLITSEKPLRDDEPCTGGTLRVHGIAEGLRAHGHDVLISHPRESVRESDPDDRRRAAHAPETIREIVFDQLPDVIIVEQWGLANYLPEVETPVVIDLHGPLSLENAFKKKGNFRSDALTKIDALARADLLTVPGKAQKQYFLSWFLFSGANPQSPPILRIPLSVDAIAARRESASEPVLVFGGSTWPWIDPFPALEIAAVAAQKAKGRLDLYVGAPDLASTHPLYDVNRGVFQDYRKRLKPFPAAHMHGLVPRETLLPAYTKARAAMDVYQSNPERELAYSSRTVEYLCAGLPVITSGFMELAEDVSRYDAGWIVDPTDERAIEKAVSEALGDAELAAKKRAGALRLASERFAHKAAVAPLAEWIANPVRRARGRTLVSDIRDYYRVESVRYVDEARESVTRVNEEMRATALAHQQQLSDKEQRYDALIQDMRRREEQNESRFRELNERYESRVEDERRQVRLLQDEIKELQRRSVESADALRRDMNDRHERELADLRTTHRDELKALIDRGADESERAANRYQELETELRRLSQDRERLVREHDEAIKALQLRDEDRLVEQGRQSQKEIERRDAEIELQHRKLDEHRTAHEAEIRSLNQQIVALGVRQDEELRRAAERFEERLIEAGRTSREEIERRDRHIESQRERFETARELLETRMRELESENRLLADSREADIRALTEKERELTQLLRSAHRENEAKDERAREITERADALREEIERLTKEAAADGKALDEMKARLAEAAVAQAELEKLSKNRADAEEKLREELKKEIDRLSATHESEAADLRHHLEAEQTRAAELAATFEELTARYRAENADLLRSLESERAERATIQERAAEDKVRLDQSLADLMENLKAEQERADQLMAAAEEQVALFRAEIEDLTRSLESEKSRAAEDSRAAEVQKGIMAAEIADLTTGMEAERDRNTLLTETIEHLTESDQAAVKDLLERLESEIRAREDLTAQIEKLTDSDQQASADLKERLNVEIRERQLLAERIQEQGESYDRARQDLEDRLEAENRANQELVQELERISAVTQGSRADLEERLALELSEKERAVNEYNHKVKELEAAQQQVRDYQGRLEQLHKDFEARFQELDRALTDRESDVRLATERFERMEQHIGEQDSVIRELEKHLAQAQADLRRTAADLQATVQEFRRAQTDLERSVRHAADLTGDLDTLRRRNALAERILMDLRDDDTLRSSIKKRRRVEKYFERLPLLAALWGANLASNTYMEWWQRRKGVQIFPGMKKTEDADRPKPR